MTTIQAQEVANRVNKELGLPKGHRYQVDSEQVLQVVNGKEKTVSHPVITCIMNHIKEV